MYRKIGEFARFHFRLHPHVGGKDTVEIEFEKHLPRQD